MMSDKDFAELELRAAICPHQIRWPKDALHWRKLHEAADEARARVTEAYTEMDEIERNASLSSDIKYRRRCEIADQAIAKLRGVENAGACASGHGGCGRKERGGASVESFERT
jgi:hypothetical protein